MHCRTPATLLRSGHYLHDPAPADHKPCGLQSAILDATVARPIGELMAKPNYSYQKRQRELEAKKKREEKLQRRRERKQEDEPSPEESDADPDR
jgi:hypothetical protein